jgi:hypothetical protein
VGPDDLLAIFMRWAHVTSAIALLGGVIYARWIQLAMGDPQAARFRRLAVAAVSLLLVTGIYNLVQKTSTPPPYHAVFGVKALLALHVFAVALLLGRPGAAEAKRMRWLTGVAASGLAIALLSAYLRRLSS